MSVPVAGENAQPPTSSPSPSIMADVALPFPGRTNAPSGSGDPSGPTARGQKVPATEMDPGPRTRRGPAEANALGFEPSACCENFKGVWLIPTPIRIGPTGSSAAPAIIIEIPALLSGLPS